MTKLHAPSRFSPISLARGFAGFVARLSIGLVLIFVAGFVAMITAVAGIVLALAALIFRSAGRRTGEPVTSPATPVTLEARRTPRGWTVE